MTIDDETLILYLDNELPPEERERVNEALRTDEGLRARLKRQERVREMLSATFDPVLREAPSEELVERVLTAPVSWRWRLLNAWTTQLHAVPRTAIAPRLAFAALMLAVGIAIGWSLTPRISGGFGGTAPLVAQGELATVLETRLASDDSAGPRVGLTFRTAQGKICRTFDIGASTDNKAGIACRAGNAWAIAALVATEPHVTTPYAPAAAAMPDAIRDAVTTMTAGTPFDAAQERQSRANGWR